MFGFSFGEIIFIAVLALVVIGPKQLPIVAGHVARFLNELKRASSGLTDEFKRQAKFDIDAEIKKTPPKPAAPKAPAEPAGPVQLTLGSELGQPVEPKKPDLT